MTRSKKTTTEEPKEEKILFIVESPNKVSTIQKYLDKKKYVVAASVGHCFNLPKKDFVDIKDNFKLNYELDPKKKDVLKKILDLGKDCTEIQLSTDMDQEGSVISWTLYEYLKTRLKGRKFTRVNLKEITKKGIDDAIKASYPITDPKEFNIVQAGQVRRIEDRFTGFKISPLAFVYVQAGTSAGRVQSPALRMICEREREITAFIPEVYYEIYADLICDGEVFRAKYPLRISDEKTAKAILAGCTGKPIKVVDISKKESKSKASPPFITKTLLASASTILGWKAAKTTDTAQQLFNMGLVTYIRTDDPKIASEFQSTLIDHVKHTYTNSYHVKTLPDYHNKDAKLEHECIRPTDLNATPALNPDQKKLYDLIRRRFLAAGMAPATFDSVSVDLEIGTHKFKASGSTLTFDGFLKEWNFYKKEDVTLPPITEASKITARDIFDERKETKPPPRYKDASLIEALEKKGIGKPSTFKSILDILDKREYIKYDKQNLLPSELGFRLNDFLCKYFNNIIDYDFTARVEKEQEEVAEGKLTYVKVVSEFYNNLLEELKVAREKISKDKKEDEETLYTCPKCKIHGLLKKINKKDGIYFYSCSGYLDKSCSATFSIGEDGSPKESGKSSEILCTCPDKSCGGDLVKRTNRKTGEIFYACTNWTKGCKVTANAAGEIKVPVKPKIHGKCEKCKKGDMIERTSKKGEIFLGCSNFPRCKNAKSLEDKPSTKKASTKAPIKTSTKAPTKKTPTKKMSKGKK